MLHFTTQPFHSKQSTACTNSPRPRDLSPKRSPTIGWSLPSFVSYGDDQTTGQGEHDGALLYPCNQAKSTINHLRLILPRSAACVKEKRQTYVPMEGDDSGNKSMNGEKRRVNDVAVERCWRRRS